MTIRGLGNSEDPDAYWKRRFIILGGGLTVLMILAWTFGGGGPSKQESQRAAVRASVAARQARSPLPSAALGSPSPLPSPSVTPLPSGSASPSASGSATASPSAAAGYCAKNDIVLSLFTSQQEYLPSQQPRFNVYAVSTAASACKLPFGPGAVRMIVTRRGQVVWDSSGCKRAKPVTVSLAQGVPQEVTVSWDRKASSKSCAGSLPSRTGGTFQAVAMDDGHTSPVRTFRLRGSVGTTPRKPARNHPRAHGRH